MLLLCYDNNISLQNLDNNIFSSIKGDQLISGDKSRLLLWKEILIKAYVPISSQWKVAKWYTKIRNLITSDGIHLNNSITQLFGAYVDNVDEDQSYDITKKNRSLIAFYNSQFNSVVIGKIQGIDETQRSVIKHFHIDMSQCTDTHTYIYQCMEYGCAANEALSTRSPCTFSADWECLVPLLTDSQFASSQPTNLIEFNIFDIFSFAKKKYDILQKALMQTPFDNNNYYIFKFYTDGSLIDLGTEQCSVSCAFTQISDLFDVPHVEFYSTIDKWPSAYRGELLAVFLALSVVPKNSKVRINTDSLNVITQFEKLKKSRFSHTLREYFKANNNFLWFILCRIILTLNLHVEMFKVIAHGDDVVFRHDAIMMKVLSRWNGIIIENKLCSFLKNICNYKGLDKFINLNRNSKYRQLEVDWTSTFNCLNCDISNNEDSVSSSKTKAQKVHLLIEEIPTIEQMKKSLLDLDKTINCLLTWILEYNDNIHDFNNLMALNIWDISYDPNGFTFIDLIKGIIPMLLSKLLNSWTTKKNVADVL
ncbi:hypothetical protein RhiirC2_799466, partial [Rhizophagus irregularis]